jgi:hypothetical protein
MRALIEDRDPIRVGIRLSTDPVRVARGKEHIDPRSGTEWARLYDLCRAEKDRARGIAQPVQTHKHDCG